MTVRAWWRRLLGLWLIVGLAGSLWAASLVICPKCGTEADAGVTLCSHCGALLPVKVELPSAVPAAVTPEKKGTTSSDLALEAARTDKRLALESLPKRPDLAYAFGGNALALSRLVKREGGSADVGKSLAENLERYRNLLAYTTRPCPACSGAGKRSVQFQQLSGDKTAHLGATPLQVADGTACQACGGRGVVSAGRSADERRVLIAQGWRDFETRQQAQGRVACGRVWVPSDLLALLDVKAQALLRVATPTPCAGCMGLGIQDCSRCKGAGQLKCNNPGCVNGCIIVKEANALSAKTALNRKEHCPTCQGSGLMPCTDCRGGGTVACVRCNGTGRNAVCADCGGQGWEACPKCKGAGMVSSGTCPDCHGEKVILCPKCHGEGCAAK